VLLPSFTVDGVLDAVADAGASLFFGVPTMYHRLAASSRVGELARLRLCVSGSAALPAALHHALEERSGQRVLERYGMTETLMNVSNLYDGDRRPGSVGLPLPGVEVALDGDEILVRGPNVFARYWERPDATAEAFRNGWFATGDLGAEDDDGYLRILGRAKELIISGGLNVYPREVEEVLLGHPAVAEAAVVGTPSDEWGEVVTAYIVRAAPVTVDELTAYALARLAAFKRPRVVRFVDALPRNAMGKVVKHELHD
jgi:malonyl-CoA/methylmalonyl-CoA synthetase